MTILEKKYERLIKKEHLIVSENVGFDLLIIP